MKNLLFTICLLFTFTIYAQNDSIIQPSNIAEAERLIDKYGGQLKEDFNNMIKDVTPMAEEGFKVVVRLQVAKGITYLIPTVVFFIALPFFIKYGKEDFDSFQTFIVGMITFISFIIAIFSTYHGVLHIMAPEWFAVKEIIGLVA